MTFKNFKTNWFSITMAIIILIAIGRKIMPDMVHHLPFFNQAKADKITDKGSTQLGVFGKRPEEAALDMDAAQAGDFVRRFSHVAVSESKKFKVPASVIMAWALVQSQAGTAAVTQEARNFFGLRCDEDWEGGGKTLSGICYRQYETPWESFRDFSIYVSSRDWYGDVRKKAGKDGPAWAKQMQEKSIGDAEFAQKIAAVMQAFSLQKLDAH